MREKQEEDRSHKRSGGWGTGDLSEEDSKLLEYVPDFLETAIKHPKREGPPRKKQSKTKGRK